MGNCASCSNQQKRLTIEEIKTVLNEIQTGINLLVTTLNAIEPAEDNLTK
jgi:hypothetical protein